MLKFATNLAINFVQITTITAAGMIALSSPAHAQTAQAFPAKPLKIVVPFTPGGTNDVMARMIGNKLNEYWGQPVIVENKPGASGWIGNNAVARAEPDGYTTVLTISNIIYAPSLYKNIPYDIKTDFAPISMLSRSPITLVVPASSPANTLEEFIDMVRKNPGKHNYGSFGQGTTAHIYGETLRQNAKIDLLHTPYKGTAAIVSDMLGGLLSSGFIDTATARAHMQSGKIKMLAVTGTKRVASMPSVPTFLELGHKGFEPVGFFLVLAPAKTPKDIVKKLSEGVTRAMRTPEITNKMQDLGQEVVAGTPEELAAAMKTDAEIFDRIIKQANITVEN